VTKTCRGTGYPEPVKQIIFFDGEVLKVMGEKTRESRGKQRIGPERPKSYAKIITGGGKNSREIKTFPQLEGENDKEPARTRSSKRQKPKPVTARDWICSSKTRRQGGDAPGTTQRPSGAAWEEIYVPKLANGGRE